MSRTDKTKPLWVRFAEHSRHGYPEFGTTCCSGPNGRAAKRERGEMNRARNRKARYAARLATRRLTLEEDLD
ncbi:hypothetical protein ACQPW1_27980 [Nocardia sp. CA-128927]|uniref:hypothetical protein n=1 Tax=Nocardia sp. CA-128927 TaxID=3239975 RepID=UPI003D958A66